jgi:hypothetical protein
VLPNKTQRNPWRVMKESNTMAMCREAAKRNGCLPVLKRIPCLFPFLLFAASWFPSEQGSAQSVDPGTHIAVTETQLVRGPSGTTAMLSSGTSRTSSRASQLRVTATHSPSSARLKPAQLLLNSIPQSRVSPAAAGCSTPPVVSRCGSRVAFRFEGFPNLKLECNKKRPGTSRLESFVHEARASSARVKILFPFRVCRLNLQAA